MNRRAFLDVVRWAVPTLVVVFLVAPAAAPSETGCSGTWHNGKLDCSGSDTCEGQQRCHPVTQTDSTGQYKVCMCNADEVDPACCHTIERNGGPDGKGTCSNSEPWECGGGVCADLVLGPDADFQCLPPGGG